MNLSPRPRPLDSSGNTQTALATFTKQDGTTGQMGDYLFNTNTINTIPDNPLPVPQDIQALPYLPGSGTVCDSWQAMVRDSSGTLESLIKSFASENDPTTRCNILYAKGTVLLYRRE